MNTRSVSCCADVSCDLSRPCAMRLNRITGQSRILRPTARTHWAHPGPSVAALQHGAPHRVRRTEALRLVALARFERPCPCRYESASSVRGNVTCANTRRRDGAHQTEDRSRQPLGFKAYSSCVFRGVVFVVCCLVLVVYCSNRWQLRRAHTAVGDEQRKARSAIWTV